MSIEPDKLEQNIKSDGLQVLDVRSQFEYASGHIPGAVNLPFWKIPFGVSRFAPDKNKKTVLYCEHGPRAAIAHAMLKSIGYNNVSLLKGHMHGWRRENRDIDR